MALTAPWPWQNLTESVVDRRFAHSMLAVLAACALWLHTARLPTQAWARSQAQALQVAPAPTETTPQVVGEACAGDVVQFYASEEDRARRMPSLALVQPLQATGDVPVDFAVRPVFQIIHRRHAVRIDVDAGTSLYGTGEVPGPLLRNGRRTTAWNFDAYGWGDDTLHLYQSHPWVLAVRGDGSAFGVLADTSERCHIDLRDGILLVADGPPFPVVIIERDNPRDVIRTLADLTGHMPLPPRWALGYHQCRYSYTPDSRVLDVATEFRRRRIPCDVIWLDIDYMNDYRCFTFDPTTFSNPEKLTAKLHAEGFRTVAIIDPGIKQEDGYDVYDSGTAIDAWVKTPRGDAYTGKVWPGMCVFPDFTNARIREWWGDLYAPFLAKGIDGIWNDMNEPAIFDVDSKTMPLNNVHFADAALGGTGKHTRFHNVYGMLMARATREGISRARPKRRAFVLTRANFIGGQRYAATWTGDNTANWYHLGVSIPMVLTLGLSGQPFAGPDIGGFAGAGAGRLFARWMGIGALLPFARGHTGKGNIDKEPWAFGPEVEATCKRALERRMRLLPYFYTLFREASRTGLPVARPLFLADPANARLRDVGDAFLLGDDLLVLANTHSSGNASTVPPFPEGAWTRFDADVGDAEDPELPGLFVRSGSIVPLGPVLQHVDEAPLDPLELVIHLDTDGTATGVLYEDEGDGHGFEHGEFRLTHFLAKQEANVLQLETRVQEGDWQPAQRAVRVRLVSGTAERRFEAASAPRTTWTLD